MRRPSSQKHVSRSPRHVVRFKLPDIPKAWKPDPAKLWASQAVPPPKEENLKPSVPTYGPKGKGRQDGMSADKVGIQSSKRLLDINLSCPALAR